jgi:hypothetical protein
LSECERLRADAPGLAALPADAPERLAAWAHASGCAACARALREAERLQALVAARERPPLAAGSFEWASRAIIAELRREARRRMFASIAAVSVALAAFVGFARDRSRAAEDWAWAAVLGALALVLAAAARRRAPLALTAAVLAAVTAAMATGRPGPLAVDVGVRCLTMEIASAAMVVGAVWLAIRGGTTSPARAAVAAAAAAGALAGDAALQVTCAARDAIPHLLAFHVGGVLLAVVGASLLWGRRGRSFARGASPST